MAKIVTTADRSAQRQPQTVTSSKIVTSANIPQATLPAAPQPAPPTLGGLPLTQSTTATTGYAQIQSDGAPLPARKTLNLVGALSVFDDKAGDRTTAVLGGGGQLLASVVSVLPSLHAPEGARCFVESMRAMWQYVADGATFPIDHVTAEATADGGDTRWVRDLQYNDAVWRTLLSDVYIDPVNGNDENQGIYTSAPNTPASLMTMMELWRRWGEALVTANVGTSEVIIHIMGNIPAPDELQMLWRNGPDTYVRILGEVTTALHSGTLDGVNGWQLWDAAAADGGRPNIIKDSTGTLDWTPYIGKRVHFTRVNSWAYILKNLGGGQARISVPQFSDEPNFSLIPTNVFPANGDAYAVEDGTAVPIGTTDLKTTTTATNVFGPDTAVQASNLRLIPSNAFSFPHMSFRTDPRVGLIFYQCTLEGVVITLPSNTTFSNCTAWGLDWAVVGQFATFGFAWFGGAFVRTDGHPLAVTVTGVGISDTGALDYYTHVQGGPVVCTLGASIRACAVFDTPLDPGINPSGHAILLGLASHHGWPGHGIQLIDRGGIPTFGNGAAGAGIFIASNASVLYETKPTITGTLGDFLMGGSDGPRFFNTATGAYSAVISPTWSNLSAATPGGLGGHAHNLTDNCHLVPID